MRQEPLECDINIAVNSPFWVEVGNPERPFTVRGLPFSTYALMGEGGLKELLICGYDSTDSLHEMRTRGMEGVKNPENFCVRTKWKPPNVDIPL